MHACRTMSILFVIPALLLPVSPVAAQADETVTDSLLTQFRRDNLALYHELRFDEARSAAVAILDAPGESALSRLRALSTLVALNCSTGDEEGVAVAVGDMLGIDENAVLQPPRRYASPVVQCFYAARGQNALEARPVGTRRINTIAVGEFRNHSVMPGAKPPFDLDHFAKGLGQLVQFDLSAVTGIELVDRERLTSLEREIAAESAGSASFDDEMRIAAGRLCGAHAFLFGSVMMVGDEKIRIGVRLVATATGEVLLAERVEGKLRTGRDLIRLEEELVRDLLGPRIDEVVEAYNGKEKAATHQMSELFASKKKEWNRDGAYLSFLLESGEALRFEESGEYGAAMGIWSRIARDHPGDPRVMNRLLGLRAFLHGQAELKTEPGLPRK